MAYFLHRRKNDIFGCNNNLELKSRRMVLVVSWVTVRWRNVFVPLIGD